MYPKIYAVHLQINTKRTTKHSKIVVWHLHIAWTIPVAGFVSSVMANMAARVAGSNQRPS